MSSAILFAIALYTSPGATVAVATDTPPKMHCSAPKPLATDYRQTVKICSVQYK